MNFEYNGNLLEEDRIASVVNDIVSKYPQINKDRAKQAAMLEGKISSTVTSSNKLDRLYNIMLVCNDDKDLVTLVYKDYLHILDYEKLEFDNTKYMDLAPRIYTFLQGTSEFPYMSDYQ